MPHERKAGWEAMTRATLLALMAYLNETVLLLRLPEIRRW